MCFIVNTIYLLIVNSLTRENNFAFIRKKIYYAIDINTGIVAFYV